jgi:inosose dehydratase
MSLRRRNLLGGAAACLVSAALPGSALAQPRRLRIGHTGITWGYAPQNAEQAIADVGRLGFHGFESFGSVIEYWEARGGIGRLLEAAGVPLVGAYCPMILTDPGQRSAEIDKITRWGRLIRKYGGTIAVIGPDNVDREHFDFRKSRASIVATLDDIGRVLEDIGLVGAVHQHSGSCIQTRDETDAVLEAVDTSRVRVCPDTGELLNAGIDPVGFLRDYLPLVAHAHIKDFDAGAYNDGYCPVGTGRVDVGAVLDLLESAHTDFMIMAELNPNADNESAPPYELARLNRAAFEARGYSFG